MKNNLVFWGPRSFQFDLENTVQYLLIFFKKSGQTYELKCMMSSEESLTISCLLHDVKNGDLNSNVTIKVLVARYVI